MPDDEGLSHEQRERLDAEIMTELLQTARAEAHCCWEASIEWRADADSKAVLGLELIVRPMMEARGPSPEHAYDIVGVGAR